MKKIRASLSGFDTTVFENSEHGSYHLMSQATMAHERDQERSFARMAPSMALHGVTWRDISRLDVALGCPV